MSIESLQQILKDKNKDFGLVKLETPLSLNLYKKYLDQGYHGEMKYLETQLDQKEKPQKLLSTAKSAIVIRRDYLPHPYPTSLPNLKMAAYAKGEDYHFWFKKEMNELIEVLKVHFPKDDFVCFTDSSPVMERDLAYRAGLGWVGKNSCLISPQKGSFFFIGEIYTSIDIGTHKEVLVPDRCGTCTRCIDACPTNAINDERTLDATKCISYLTIEAKEAPPLELRDKLNGWYFGCDICQNVCPWNQKAFGKDFFIEAPIHKVELEENLRTILSASNRQIEKIFATSALLRAGPTAHRRNAILLAVEHQFKDLLEVIIPLGERFSKLTELVEWAKVKLT
ncbi:MAG: tRNA epoxyqueuosine(34) reductase QueG [Bdellovibrionales bacterium]|nr:tRNA epoxyqueuosine(34) reductase QueG [Bdellovibrionales bacterium]